MEFMERRKSFEIWGFRYFRPVVQRQRHLSYKEETGVRFPPGRLGDRFDLKPMGPRVRRRHSSMVRRGTEFDSRADLSIGQWAAGLTG